jgi:hypothetical protein
MLRKNYSRKAIHIHALIKNSHNESNKHTKVKIIFLGTVCHNSVMLRSILIIFRELLNIHKTYKKRDGLLNTIKFLHKIFVGVIKFISSNANLISLNIWSRYCATTRKGAGSIPDVVIWIFRWLNPSSSTMVLGPIHSLIEMSTSASAGR